MGAKQVLYTENRSAGLATLDRPLAAALAAVGLFTIATTALAAVWHLGDRFFVNHVSSSWIALTFAVDHGSFYPALFDGERFGGTRYMPTGIVLHWMASQITGEYVTSAKAIGGLLCALMLILTYRAMTRLGAPRSVALALIAGIIACHPGQMAAWSVRGDALPALLQLVAVIWMTNAARAPSGMRPTVGAAILCAFAMLTKLSAIWAAVAIGLWLLYNDRRRAAWFAIAYTVVLAAGISAFNAWSDGRMLQNLVALSTAGLTGLSAIVKSPLKLNYFLIHDAAALWALVPLATAGTVLAVANRRATLLHVALVAALGVLLMVLSDGGAMQNHLLDVGLLTALCTALAFRQFASSEAALFLLKAVILWATASAFVTLQWPSVKDSLWEIGTGKRAEHLRLGWLSGLMDPTDDVLSEDPLIPVLNGQRPVVGDAYMVATIADKHPAWVQEALVDKLARGGFDRVILLREAEPHDEWYQHSLGVKVIAAVQRHYRLDRRARDYHIYVPTSTSTSLPAD